MAILMLHQILFSLTKVTNVHLLLDESHRLIWKAQWSSHEFTLKLHDSDCGNISTGYRNLTQNSEGQTIDSFIYTHLTIFIAYLITFLICSLSTMIQTDRKNSHRSQLVRSIMLAIGFYGAYLAAISSNLKNNQPSSSLGASLAIYFQIVLTVILTVGINWAQATIGTIGDVFVVSQCIKELGSQASRKKHYKFVTYLIFGSIACASGYFLLTEALVSVPNMGEFLFGYTKLTLVLALLALVMDLICLALFTSNRDETFDQTDSSASDGLWTMIMSIVPPKVILSLNDEASFETSTQKAIYSLEDAPKKISDAILSISAQALQNLGEIHQNIEDEECNNSEDLNNIMNSTESTKKPCDGDQLKKVNILSSADLFDRSKFSLYEDFESPIEFDSSPQTAAYLYDNISMKPDETVMNSMRNSSLRIGMLIESLLEDDGSDFVLQVTLLILTGAMYQANQLCFYGHYISYLVHDTSGIFTHSRKEEQTTLMMELCCASFISQTLAKVPSLYYANILVATFGHRILQLIITSLSLTIPAQFYMNFLLTTLSLDQNPSKDIRSLIILGHLVGIQLQVGLIGGLIEYMINDLALKYDQHFVSHVRSKTQMSADKINLSAHCTIHSLLSNSFYSLGGALMSAVGLVVYLFAGSGTRKGADMATIFASLTPSLVLLSLLTATLGACSWNCIRNMIRLKA